MAEFDGGSSMFDVEVSQGQHFSYNLLAAVTFLNSVVLCESL